MTTSAHLNTYLTASARLPAKSRQARSCDEAGPGPKAHSCPTKWGPPASHYGPIMKIPRLPAPTCPCHHQHTHTHRNTHTPHLPLLDLSRQLRAALGHRPGRQPGQLARVAARWRGAFRRTRAEAARGGRRGLVAARGGSCAQPQRVKVRGDELQHLVLFAVGRAWPHVQPADSRGQALRRGHAVQRAAASGGGCGGGARREVVFFRGLAMVAAQPGRLLWGRCR